MKLQLRLKSLERDWKLMFQIAVGMLSVALAVYFIKHERTELTQVKTALLQANRYWLVSGIVLVGLFVAVQGWMYQFSFRAVHQKIPFKVGMLLYLKRNFISIFIPAGTLTYILFFNKEVEVNQHIEKRHIYYASSIFSICSILSSILIIIPALIFLFLMGGLKVDMAFGILGVAMIIALIIWVVISIARRGFAYKAIVKEVPSFAKLLDEMRQQSYSKVSFLIVLALSLVIELIGIAHLYIAMGALGVTPSFPVALIGYALVLVILLSSPFLRGLGAIELALTYSLTLFHYGAVNALSVVFLFRFFEFWSVMLLGLVVLLFRKDGLFMQLLAPVLILFLGITNLLSALTPALTARIKLLRDFIPYDMIEISNAAIIVIGVILIATSFALLRGYKNSYYLALFLSGVSLLGHLFKGIDYEESILAAITIGVLLYERKTYFIRSVPLQSLKWENGLIFMIFVLVYGVIGFYMLDVRHFNIDFTWKASIIETIRTYILLNGNLNPVTSFGRYFLYSINMLGISSILYFIWILYKRLRLKPFTDSSDLQKARQLVKSYGNSSMDYFKTYQDKQIYFFGNDEGFISYKTTSRYAVVLENPVLKDFSPELLSEKILEFEKAMLSHNPHAVYHRIPESFIGIYEALGKKKLLVGEDAYVGLEVFTLKGRAVSSLRNSINKMVKSGYTFKVNKPPQNDDFLQQLAYVSNNWLEDMGRTEMGFSQGYFIESELRKQTILSVDNPEGKVVAFLNIIESSVEGEINFDLMRKTPEAPGGTMDFLFAKMMQYYLEQGYTTISLGIVPLSGIGKPRNVPEQAMKLAYEHISQFEHYKNLRFFKEKFNPYWVKVYAVYDTDLDLVNLTTVLNKVMKPGK